VLRLGSESVCFLLAVLDWSLKDTTRHGMCDRVWPPHTIIGGAGEGRLCTRRLARRRGARGEEWNNATSDRDYSDDAEIDASPAPPSVFGRSPTVHVTCQWPRRRDGPVPLS
jgi:hypothetical protein